MINVSQTETMHQKLLAALSSAVQELEKIAATKNPVRKRRALAAAQQAMEMSDFLKNPKLYQGTTRGQNIARILRQAFNWIYGRKAKRKRTYYIILGLEKFTIHGRRSSERCYAIYITQGLAAFSRAYPHFQTNISEYRD